MTTEYTHHPHPTPKDDSRQMIPAAIVVAGALIAAAVYFGGAHPANVAGVNNGTNNAAPITVEDVSSKDHLIGNPKADIVVVEYSDFECPFCKVFHNTMHQVLDTYGDKVAWVYRQFPIASLHPKAPKESEASECATEQGGNTAFWKFADEIFDRTQSNNSLDPNELPKIASDIGLDVGAFNTCLSSGKYTETIQDDIVAAAKAGAQGTPYSVILKGDQKVVINGAEPIESVKAKIDALLK